MLRRLLEVLDGRLDVVGRRVCAWCGLVMGPAPGIDGDTHGICEPCMARVMAEVKQ